MEETIKLSVLQELFANKHKYFMNQERTHTGVPDDSEGIQGEYNKYIKYYRHPDMPEGVFMREVYQTDSYGYNESIVKIEFIKGKSKTITIYQPI